MQILCHSIQRSRASLDFWYPPGGGKAGRGGVDGPGTKLPILLDDCIVIMI